MKRIYKKRTRSAIKEKALNQIKETRSKMYEEHPELFKAIELLVKQSQKQSAVKEDSIAIDKEKNIETGIHYKPIHEMSYYRKKNNLPVTNSISTKLVSIPIHPNLSNSDVDRIIKTINQII